MITTVGPGMFTAPAFVANDGGGLGGMKSFTVGTGGYSGTKTTVIAAADAPTQKDFYITSLFFRNTTGATVGTSLRIYIGGAGSEVLVTEANVSKEDYGAATTFKDRYDFPWPLFIPGATRVSVDGASVANGGTEQISFVCVLKENVIDDSLIAAPLLQANVVPTANTVTDLVAIPAGRYLSGPSFMVNNQGANDQYFSVAIAPLGAADAAGQYILKDVQIQAGQSMPVTLPALLQATDKIRVKTDGSSVAFIMSTTLY